MYIRWANLGFLNPIWDADNHQVHVLTRSRSKAKSIFPGKKVTTSSNFWTNSIKLLNVKVNLLNFFFEKKEFHLLASFNNMYYWGIYQLFLTSFLYLLVRIFPYFSSELEFVDKTFPGIMIAEESEWKDCIQGSTAVVNLAGMPISTRWSSEVCIANSLKFLSSAGLLFMGWISHQLIWFQPLYQFVQSFDQTYIA